MPLVSDMVKGLLGRYSEHILAAHLPDEPPPPPLLSVPAPRLPRCRFGRRALCCRCALTPAPPLPAPLGPASAASSSSCFTLPSPSPSSSSSSPAPSPSCPSSSPAPCPALRLPLPAPERCLRRRCCRGRVLCLRRFLMPPSSSASPPPEAAGAAPLLLEAAWRQKMVGSCLASRSCHTSNRGNTAWVCGCGAQGCST